MAWERRGLVETRPHAKVLSIRPVYALFRANGPAFEYRGFFQTHAHRERQSLRLPPAILYRVQQPHKCSLEDRKSTRLNSSHQIISYAVFCLKKKKKTIIKMKTECEANQHRTGTHRQHICMSSPL